MLNHDRSYTPAALQHVLTDSAVKLWVWYEMINV